MEKWNARCARTFPENQVRNGDQIIYINKECDHSKFSRIIGEDERLFMVIRRVTEKENGKKSTAAASSTLPSAK